VIDKEISTSILDMSEAVEPSEWQPDWLSELVNRSTRSAILSTPFTSDQTEAHLPAPSEQQNDPISSGNSANASQPPLADSESTHIFDYREETRLPVTPSGERSVRRTLKGIHLFVRVEILYHNAPRSSNQMITVNATLGTGLYWRGGQILELGGPLAVLVSFLVVGLLSWAVMQCITEMLCIWPIPGALSVYVSQFVDEELGITVGITYWFVCPQDN
jgi:amino acid transporter